jgi:hypothetical protein
MGFTVQYILPHVTVGVEDDVLEVSDLVDMWWETYWNLFEIV